MSLLHVEQLCVRFGGLLAVDKVSFSVQRGEVLSLIGPNGAGKTTTFNLISRLFPATSGRMLFDGQDFGQLPAHHVAQLGIARTFQNLELFDNASVLDNLLVGRHRHRKHGFLAEAWFGKALWRQELESRRAVEDVIDFLNLHRYRDKAVGTLSYGVRKVVELGRALACGPKLLLLDEPSSGLNVEETQDMAFWIRDIQRVLGITVLLIEHDMTLVSSVSDRVLALHQGKVLAEGTAREVQQHPKVVEAYLGGQR